jgi:hypothetical protein
VEFIVKKPVAFAPSLKVTLLRSQVVSAKAHIDVPNRREMSARVHMLFCKIVSRGLPILA